MKRLSTALLGAGLFALAACGGGAANNTANLDSGNDVYNVAPDDLGLDNFSNDSSGNATDANASANASSGNTSGNAH